MRPPSPPPPPQPPLSFSSLFSVCTQSNTYLCPSPLQQEWAKYSLKQCSAWSLCSLCAPLSLSLPSLYLFPLSIFPRPSCGTVVLVCVCSIARTGCYFQMDLTLLSLSIKISLLPSPPPPLCPSPLLYFQSVLRALLTFVLFFFIFSLYSEHYLPLSFSSLFSVCTQSNTYLCPTLLYFQSLLRAVLTFVLLLFCPGRYSRSGPSTP